LSTIYNLNCYYIDKNISNKFNSLYITPLNDSIEICFAIRKGNTELLSFLNKCLALTSSSIVGGGYYKTDFANADLSRIWLCPVTLFVLGRYPEYIYFRRIEKK
jgi:hypothetical protein